MCRHAGVSCKQTQRIQRLGQICIDYFHVYANHSVVMCAQKYCQIPLGHKTMSVGISYVENAVEAK